MSGSFVGPVKSMLFRAQSAERSQTSIKSLYIYDGADKQLTVLRRIMINGEVLQRRARINVVLEHLIVLRLEVVDTQPGQCGVTD